jgi:hypothetical protein
MNNTMQELVSDSGDIQIRPVKQYIPGQEVPDKLFQVQFGQVYLSAPHVVEKVSLDAAHMMLLGIWSYCIAYKFSKYVRILISAAVQVHNSFRRVVIVVSVWS